MRRGSRSMDPGERFDRIAAILAETRTLLRHTKVRVKRARPRTVSNQRWARIERHMRRLETFAKLRKSA